VTLQEQTKKGCEWQKGKSNSLIQKNELRPNTLFPASQYSVRSAAIGLSKYLMTKSCQKDDAGDASRT